MTRRHRWTKGTWMRLTSPKALRGYMEDKGFTQERLARYAGLNHRSFIGHLLTGERKTCRPRTAELIAEALGVPLEALFVPSVTTDSGHNDKQHHPTRKAAAA